MNIYIENCYFHEMNRIGLNTIINHLGWNRVQQIGQADVIYSPSKFLNTKQYPNKKYIFGPHFSVFPNPDSRKIDNSNNNAIYIQPSKECVDLWVKEFNFSNIPVKTFPFPVDVNEYSPSDKPKTKVLIYFKQRLESELNLVKKLLDERGVIYEIIRYGNYNETNYKEKLDETKYIIWLGRHESQGFALQCALSKNIPILVWSAKYLKQEVGNFERYKNVQTEITTVPYWDNTCGVRFYTDSELESSYDNFINNLEHFKPRNFILDNLSVEACSKNLINIINE